CRCPVRAGPLDHGRDTPAAPVRHVEGDGRHPDDAPAGETAVGVARLLVHQVHGAAGVEEHRVEGSAGGAHYRTSSTMASPRSARDRATNAPSGSSLAARASARSTTDTSAGASAYAPISACASQYGLPSAPCTEPWRESRSHTATCSGPSRRVPA